MYVDIFLFMCLTIGKVKNRIYAFYNNINIHYFSISSDVIFDLIKPPALDGNPILSKNRQVRFGFVTGEVD